MSSDEINNQRVPQGEHLGCDADDMAAGLVAVDKHDMSGRPA
jgi:hypothetical protein